MSASPDEPATSPETATPESPAAQPQAGDANAPGAGAEPPQAPAPAAVAPAAAPSRPDDIPPPHILLYTVFGFLCIAIAVWLIFAWTGYKERYSQQVEGWRLGSTKMIEITLVREDKKNLACASDREFEGIHCGYNARSEAKGPGPEDDPHVLQPFNTVKNELFLAAGLWQAPALKEPLPKDRFTVTCNYHVVGVLKAVSLRWSPTGNFGPVDQSVTVGTLSDCVIPQ
jgi:hypothetical protein